MCMYSCISRKIFEIVMPKDKIIIIVQTNIRLTFPFKVAISEFGLSMLMLILLKDYMFIEFMRYLHDNK